MKIALGFLVVLSLCAPAAADVTVGYVSSSSGYRGMGASETKGERQFSGLKARREANVRFTGAVLGLLSGKKGKDVVEILRVDDDKRWDLDLKKKTYRESPITLPPPEPGEPEKKQEKAGDEKPTHRVKSVKADVKTTGETKEINGFKAARHLATLELEIEDLKTKETSKVKMTSDIWTTPWTKSLRAARDEEAKFEQAYLKKLGVDLPVADRERFGLALARSMVSAGESELGRALAKLSRELSRIDGYAVLTQTSWYGSAPPATAKRKSKDEDESSALTEAAGADSVGGAALSFMGGLAKKAVKKKAEKAMEASPDKPAFSIRTEITKVETGGVPPERFEIPKGFAKKS